MRAEDLKTNVLSNKPLDFDETWKKWLEEIKVIPNDIEIESIHYAYFGWVINFFFKSVNNTKVYVKLYKSTKSIELKRPIVVLFHGSGSNSNDDHNVWHTLNWVNQDYSVLMMDARDQGGLTKDYTDYQFKDRHYLCHGCLDKETHYDKMLYLDACRLLMLTRDKNVEVLKDYINVPVIAAGPSQGGELSLASAAITNIPFLCIPDVPSGCALYERIKNRNGKYNALSELIDEHPEYEQRIYDVCGYFDVINLADRITCPVFSSVGTIDDICPAPYYYEAYLRIKSPKEIVLYEGYGHGGFEELHLPKKFEFVKRYIKN